ncbi:hypothetical protein FN976_04460 [Caenimonas sedimenti]|uniref:Type II secretion system protein GspB C-terminal domain-containing protein n=1 Tax=Caenimonas sedimenti TaxID=2596921 RepID=A0A562ZWP2_9BURK|nr:general secretion pathway protein GspB [Caenimonas sedimenti]TWO72791.1 hypothetical protein FN976_04460 [Caenimonas sedimenti]
MSYILDALRKADAERERDPARGIHAQPAALQHGADAGRRSRWPWIAGMTAGLAVAAALAFWRPAPPAASPPVAGPITPITPSAPAPAPAPIPVPAVPAAAVQPAPPPMPAAAPPAAPVAAAGPAVAPRRVPVLPASAPAAAPPGAMPLPPAAAPAPAERVVAFADLPPDVQRDLPKLVINGGVHSENAAQRMLVVGGQVMHEGAELAPGLVLEQIRPKAAVLRFRGMRYSVPY